MIRRFCLLAVAAVVLALGPGLSVVLAPTPALAITPDEVFESPVLERRARAIFKDLRCVVCQNESIDESNAELARDMRLVVRQRLVAGDSDGQIVDFMVDRYGDYVLLRPPLKGTTYALWFGPAVFVMIAAFAGWRYYQRQAENAAPQRDTTKAAVKQPQDVAAAPQNDDPAPPPLSADEKRRLEKLLKETDGAGGQA